MRTDILFLIGLLLLFGPIITKASTRSQRKSDKLIEHICKNLNDDDLHADENRKWEDLCNKWITSIDHKQHHDIRSEDILSESSMTRIHEPRKSRSRSRSRGGSSRISRSSISGSRYRSTRSGVTISRPVGWLWSRSRHIFLPVSTRYSHRSRSSYNQYTTPATGSETYYYCTSNSNNISMEIQCSSMNGDGQCCEDENFYQAYCCGGKIEDDFVEDLNQATQILTQVFFTLSVLALFTHIFMQRFCR